jgi:hypothetical protein
MLHGHHHRRRKFDHVFVVQCIKMPPPITRTDLKGMVNGYSDSVRENEVRIFSLHIRRMIQETAKNGKFYYSHPVLPEGHPPLRTHQSLLDKVDPGPLPLNYVNEVITTLIDWFPDTDIEFIHSTDPRTPDKILIDWF